jgi:hypothetical protein
VTWCTFCGRAARARLSDTAIRLCDSPPNLLQDGETFKILGHKKAAFRYSSRSLSLECSAELARVDSAREKCLERGSHLLNFVGRFMHEFQTKVANARLAPRFDVRACFLRFSAEDRVPAAYVGKYRMRAALWISQGHPMLFAWPAAIAIRGASGKEAAKDTMLGVEDGQMLIGNRFYPLWTDGSG